MRLTFRTYILGPCASSTTSKSSAQCIVCRKVRRLRSPRNTPTLPHRPIHIFDRVFPASSHLAGLKRQIKGICRQRHFKTRTTLIAYWVNYVAPAIILASAGTFWRLNGDAANRSALPGGRAISFVFWVRQPHGPISKAEHDGVQMSDTNDLIGLIYG